MRREVIDRRLEVLAIVPARGGSKSIPRKNLQSLAGHPLIAYSIAAGRQSARVSRLVVSTDDEEIATIALRYGAELPFMRPPDLAEDHVTDLPVFQHALAHLDQAEGYVPDLVVQLRPTSPLRPPGCVDVAIDLLNSEPEADSLRTVTPAGQNPYKMWRPGERWLSPLLECDIHEPYNKPRQELPTVLWQTGHIDAIRPATILHQHSMTGRRVMPLEIDPAYAIDIDTYHSLRHAQWALEARVRDFIRPEAEARATTAGAVAGAVD